MAPDPSLGAVGIRGGVDSDGALEAGGGAVGQFGLGSRFMCEDVNGAAVAGATAVDMTIGVETVGEY